eukprot:1392465-Amorphochlora_amoeboformis.AAC.2
MPTDEIGVSAGSRGLQEIPGYLRVPLGISSRESRLGLGGANRKVVTMFSSFFESVKTGIQTIAENHLKEFGAEVKRNDALKREKKLQEDLRKKVIPPWAAIIESKAIIEADVKAKILEISKVLVLYVSELGRKLTYTQQTQANFFFDPPTKFECDLVAALPYIQGALTQDPELNKARYQLVPKRLKEEEFFRAYFYHVSIIREKLELKPLPISEPPRAQDTEPKDSIVRVHNLTP